jgi:hypothetical protein
MKTGIFGDACEREPINSVISILKKNSRYATRGLGHPTALA